MYALSRALAQDLLSVVPWMLSAIASMVWRWGIFKECKDVCKISYPVKPECVHCLSDNWALKRAATFFWLCKCSCICQSHVHSCYFLMCLPLFCLDIFFMNNFSTDMWKNHRQWSQKQFPGSFCRGRVSVIEETEPDSSEMDSWKDKMQKSQVVTKENSNRIWGKKTSDGECDAAVEQAAQRLYRICIPGGVQTWTGQGPGRCSIVIQQLWLLTLLE